MRHVACPPVLAISIVCSVSTAAAQTGGFVMLLGRDTVQVESFTRIGQHISGTVLTRMPVARRVRYDITLAPDGRLARYEQTQANGDGSPLSPDQGTASVQINGDTIVRVAPQRDGTPITHRIAAPGGAYPASTIPIGTSFVVFELALASARTTPLDQQPTLNRLLPSVGQMQPMRTRVLYRAPDSVVVDYFGQGSFGFAFDKNGRLLRSDWRGTTYKVLVTRVATLDVDRVGNAWAAADVSGSGAGALSPKDSVSFTVGGTGGFLVYSRPAARGRVIWGDLVPFERVWRLGADFATRFSVSADVMIGDTRVAAGEYTLWMLPSAQQPQLIVSKLQKVFGTQYNPSQDLARIPLRRTPLSSPVERVTLAVRDGQLVIEWGDTAYSVGLRTP